jgi:hypothetical protein
MPCRVLRCADAFSGRDLTGVALTGLDTVMFVAVDDAGMVSLRPYYLAAAAPAAADGAAGAGGEGGGVTLTPMGPDIDWVVRRVHVPSPDLDKLAHKTPAQ